MALKAKIKINPPVGRDVRRSSTVEGGRSGKGWMRVARLTDSWAGAWAGQDWTIRQGHLG